MALRFGRLDDTNRPAFEQLLEHAWEQNWGSELANILVRWRYYEKPPGSETLLAFDGDQCIAVLDSFVRPYLLDGRDILVRETCDWFCLPKYRPFGVGIKLLRQMMAYPEPIFSIGGSQSTLAILPRLGWIAVPDIQKYVLPLKARSVAGSLLRQRWPTREALAKAIPGFIPLQTLRRAPTPSGGIAQIREWQPGMPIPQSLPDRPGLVEVLAQADLAWIARMPHEFALPLGLTFFLGEEPVGFSLSQLEPSASGLDGCIVHLQIPHETQSVVDWVIAETARRLASCNVGIIRCGASSPAKITALERAGFLIRKPHPSYWWDKDGASAPAVIDAGYLRANDAQPYEALRGRWWGARNGKSFDPAV